MADNKEQVERLFAAALEKAPSERALFMEGLGTADPDLRSAVESLLAAEEGSEPVTVEKSTAIKPLRLGANPAARIGPYHILREIGEGGMGIVYEAEQETPVRRKVALKLIKWGMDTKAVVARFESERQALALMNHPSIASVFDAGATPEGRPYFAMEYVQGISITEYCDKHRLTIKKRLHLFIAVCEGVQHAHQKGIIHRDIKPSNVLVAVQDGKPVPKIIDFGVAKATSQRLNEHTVATELGQIIGTPEYMSPEQAEMTNLDIDTQTDVYSLGVMLYELLVGAQPFDPKQLREAGLIELQRKLREEEPPRPSTRATSLGEASTTSASNRRLEVRTLQRQLKGDLDWITMKALEKDRTRRYETANALALDVERYLSSEPIRARAPSTVYRLERFVRRHRAGVAAGVGVVALLLGVLILTLVQSNRISLERDRANREAEVARQVSDFLTELFAVSDPSESRGRTVTAREILDRGVKRVEFELQDQPATQAKLMETMGTVYMRLGLYEDARRLLENSLVQRQHLYTNHHPDVARSQATLGELRGVQADFEAAAELYRKAIATQRRESDAPSLDLASSLTGLAHILSRQGDFVGAKDLLREAVEIQRRGTGDESLTVAETMDRLGMILMDQGEYDASERLLRESLAMRRRLIPGGVHPAIANGLNNLAVILFESGNHNEAEAMFRESVAITRQLFGDSHPEVATGLNNLAMVLNDAEHYGAAEESYQQALAMRRDLLGDNHPDVAQTLNNLAFLYYDMGNEARAIEFSRSALAVYQKAYPADHREVAYGMQNLAGWLVESGDYEAAEPLLRKALEINQAQLDRDHPDIAITQTGMAVLLLRTNRAAAAFEMARSAHESLTKSLTQDHWRTAYALAAKAASLAKMSRYDEAEPLLLRAYEQMQIDTGANAMHIELARNSLEELYTAWGKPEKAAEYRRVLEDTEKVQ